MVPIAPPATAVTVNAVMTTDSGISGWEDSLSLSAGTASWAVLMA